MVHRHKRSDSDIVADVYMSNPSYDNCPYKEDAEVLPVIQEQLDRVKKERDKTLSKLNMIERSFEMINNDRNSILDMKQQLIEELKYSEERLLTATFHEAKGHWKGRIKMMKRILGNHVEDKDRSHSSEMCLICGTVRCKKFPPCVNCGEPLVWHSSHSVTLRHYRPFKEGGCKKPECLPEERANVY